MHHIHQQDDASQQDDSSSSSKGPTYQLYKDPRTGKTYVVYDRAPQPPQLPTDGGRRLRIAPSRDALRDMLMYGQGGGEGEGASSYANFKYVTHTHTHALIVMSAFFSE